LDAASWAFNNFAMMPYLRRYQHADALFGEEANSKAPI
jgi:hypothetical protein